MGMLAKMGGDLKGMLDDIERIMAQITELEAQKAKLAAGSDTSDRIIG
jgi:hypothetical protein